MPQHINRVSSLYVMMLPEIFSPIHQSRKKNMTGLHKGPEMAGFPSTQLAEARGQGSFSYETGYYFHHRT